MSDRAVDVRLLGPGDTELVLSASHLFDAAPLPDQTTAMLYSERDFLWFALAQGRPVGFASATMVLHPDQRPVLFLNEIAVDDVAQRRGIGTRLMQAVFDLARSRGWASTWVLAENDDETAKSFYRSLSPATAQPSVMFEWEES
ncbi:MAG: GNAT family N-acetyltransferase [Alphaproteobacteria bacterium]|nr:GNAT family N-acetyltransferase [Alphaproteobacteria bacterium]